MFDDIIETITMYEKCGVPHTFDIIAQNLTGAAPYRVEVDDQFIATGESEDEAWDEITDYAARFGLSFFTGVLA